MNQLRALHRAGVTSNNQANQLDRLIKAVEQAKSRPIWTPNTTRQQQAELIEQLRRELNKVFTLLKNSHIGSRFCYWSWRFYRVLLVLIMRWIRFAERTISNFCLQYIKWIYEFHIIEPRYSIFIISSSSLPRLVRALHQYHKSQDSNHLKAWIFQSFFCNCTSCVFNYDDLRYIHF